jgi:hypothetical protein
MSPRLTATTAFFVIFAATSAFAIHLGRGKHKPKTAQVTVSAGEAGCAVDVDGTPAGQTSAGGTLVVTDVDASAHYVHLDCPQQPERTFFISPQPGEDVTVHPDSPGSQGRISPLAVAENRTEIRGLLSQAVNLRGDGHFPEAIQTLRKAVTLDPDNPNLHHELGTTFLMVGDWDSARIELLETLRHDPNDADAHNALGFAYEKLDEIRPAVDQYRIATHLDPGDDSYKRNYLEALALVPASPSHKKKKKKLPFP